MELKFNIQNKELVRLGYTVNESDKILMDNFLKKSNMQFKELFSQLVSQLNEQQIKEEPKSKKAAGRRLS